MTFIIASVALVFCGAFLQTAHCNALNPYYNPNPDTVAYAPTYQPTVSPAIVQDNPLYNYRDILDYPPYSLYCDCDMSPYIDQYTIVEINQIADRYNQRNCDLQQLYTIIDSSMPTLPNEPWRMNMIQYLASGLHDEQARRHLPYLPEYPSWCNNMNIYPQAMPQAMPVLAKRSPQDMSSYMPNMPSMPSSVDPMAYYYNLNYMMDRIMPDLSPQFRQTIADAVYMNTRPEELSQAPGLISRLTSNLRVTMSEMYDYMPSFY